MEVERASVPCKELTRPESGGGELKHSVRVSSDATCFDFVLVVSEGEGDAREMRSGCVVEFVVHLWFGK